MHEEADKPLDVIRERCSFGPFLIEPAARKLYRHGEPLPLTPKAFELLLVLAGNPGRALSRTQLMAALWPSTAVEEGNLTFQIFTLRKTLEDGEGKYIQTVPKYGYRFEFPATAKVAPQMSVPVEKRTRLFFLLLALLVLVLLLAGWMVVRG